MLLTGLEKIGKHLTVVILEQRETDIKFYLGHVNVWCLLVNETKTSANHSSSLQTR